VSSRSSACSSALVLALGVLTAGRADAQACCAGAGALTPGRLAMHEDALVGLELHAATQLGTFDDGARYASVAAHSHEYDYEEDLFGAVRVLRRGQVALLVPLVETARTEQGLGELGGGIGDVNLSLRYDFIRAAESRYVPGIAALAGLTAPTGRPPDDQNPSKPLGTDATGIGAWQGNLGVALEQTFGPWLVNATELLAWRAPRTAQNGGVSVGEALAPQFVSLLGAAYTFQNDASVALFGSYTLEGSATLDGTTAPASARRIALVSVSGLYPLSERLRIQSSIFLNPPLDGLGRNQTATTGLTITLVWSFS
jgi:hypothetical protein